MEFVLSHKLVANFCDTSLLDEEEKRVQQETNPQMVNNIMQHLSHSQVNSPSLSPGNVDSKACIRGYNTIGTTPSEK